MFNEFLQFILHPQFTGWFLVLKIVFSVLSVLLAIGTLYFLKKSSWLRRLILEDIAEISTYRQYGAKNVEKDWNKIMARLNTNLESEYKLAIIEAESLLDSALKQMGFTEESFGEKLKNIPPLILPNAKDVLKAHEIHNNIIHDPDFRLSQEKTKENLVIYEKAFQELQLF
ncbi:MAG: hypothetical protein Q7K11_01840 [Candidatus Berkelbacteria bacterium]|nr:hypothetical protein [Candidatus Berkelbacteria bacterium]